MITEVKIEDLLKMASARTTPGYPLLFRGEFDWFEYRTPSIYRNYINNDDNPFENKSDSFYKFDSIGWEIYDILIRQKLQYSYGFSIHNGEVIGNMPIIGWVSPGPTRLYLQIISLLQHYGLPTPFIDVTFDPFVALYFACFSNENKSYVTNGYGYIYTWDTSSFDQQSGDYYGIDLPESYKFFLSEGITSVTRPQIQKAASICCGHWVLPQTKKKMGALLYKLNEKATIFKIDRSKINYSIFEGFNPFPNEPLGKIINAFIEANE